jgi:hypothetical protein
MTGVGARARSLSTVSSSSVLLAAEEVTRMRSMTVRRVAVNLFEKAMETDEASKGRSQVRQDWILASWGLLLLRSVGNLVVHWMESCWMKGRRE